MYIYIDVIQLGVHSYIQYTIHIHTTPECKPLLTGEFFYCKEYSCSAAQEHHHQFTLYIN